MTMAYTAIAVAVVSFSYSYHQSQQAKKAQQRAQREAEERADKAKGFQFVSDGEAKALSIPFGRNKIGGVKVHLNVASKYYYADSAIETDITYVPMLPTSTDSGATSRAGDTFSKVGALDAWDSYHISKTAYKNRLHIDFNVTDPNKRMIVCFSSRGNISNESVDFGWVIQDGMAYVVDKASTAIVNMTMWPFYGETVMSKAAIPVTASTKLTLHYHLGTVYFMADDVEIYRATRVRQTMYILFAYYTPNAGLTLLSATAGDSMVNKFYANYKSSSTPIDTYKLVNTQPNWTGNWSLVKVASGTIAPKGRYITRANQKTWKRFPKSAEILAGIAMSQLGIESAPTVDYIFYEPKVTGYDTGGLPVIDASALPPTIASLGIAFPAYVKGSLNRLGANINGSKKEFLLLQQAVSVAGINSVVAVDIDERPHNSTEYAHGAMLYYYTHGNVPCPWATVNNPARADARFYGAAYFSAIFRLNRDDPQYNGAPDVTSYLEGVRCRDVLYDETTGTFFETEEKTYTTNSARVLLEYLRNTAFGKGLPADEVDYESFFKAKRVCDRVMVHNAPKVGRFWTEADAIRDIPRFECCIALDSSEPFRKNIEKILATMYAADLIWSGGKYKLQLLYPTMYSTNDTYRFYDIVQVTDTDGVKRLFRSRANDNAANNPLTSPDKWAEDVVVATIRDDDLLADTDIQIEWPDLETRLNFATVRYLNEELDFKEDTVSWPNKEPLDPSDTTYATLLAEDGNRPLEGSFFEEGITTPYHARAAAEQRVRYSRYAATYSLKTTLKLYDVEPGDIVALQSDVFDISPTLIRVSTIEKEDGAAIAISGTYFDAGLLAWNVDDSVLPTIQSEFVLPAALEQAYDLELELVTNEPRRPYYRLSWQAPEDARVSHFIVKRAVGPIENLTDATEWVTIADTPDTSVEIDGYEGLYTLAVVSASDRGKQAPWRSQEAGSEWPLLAFDFSPRFILSSIDIQVEGRTVLKDSGSPVPDTLALTAVLKYGDAEVTSGLSYRWYDVTTTPGFVINQGLANAALLYGFNNAGSESFADLGQNLPTGAAWNTDGKCLVLSNEAVTGANVFMVEVQDTYLNKIHTGYVTVSDQSDPYKIEIVSAQGDKFRNNSGSTEVWPSVYLGGSEVTDLRGWKFRYTLAQMDGRPGGFIDTARASGVKVVANSDFDPLSGSFTVTLDKSVSVQTDDLVKLCLMDFDAKYFKVKVNSSGTTLILKTTPTYNASAVMASAFEDFEFFVCKGSGDSAGEVVIDGLADPSKVAPEDFKTVVLADDIDYRGQVRVVAYKPSAADLIAAGII